jgi:hypothetical protein
MPSLDPFDDTLRVAPGNAKLSAVCEVGDVESLPALSVKAWTWPPMPVT